MLCPGSTRVGGLMVAILMWVSSPPWGSSPGLPGHNLVTRQCLGHQVPVNAWAHCQAGPAGTLCEGPSLSLVSSRGALAITGTCHPWSSFHIWDWGLWPHLAICPGRPSLPRISRLH